MNDLITAAEAALAELKRLHHPTSCPGVAHCPTAAAIANLEVEIAKAKRVTGEIVAAWPYPSDQPEATYGGGIKVEDFIPKMVNPPPTTIDPHDVADAILRARPQQFMPSAHRICWQCDQILPDSTPEGTNLCRRCQP